MHAIISKQKSIRQPKSFKSTSRKSPSPRKKHAARLLMQIGPTFGNQKSMSMLQINANTSNDGFRDLGKVGTVRLGDTERGLTSADQPRIFVNGGRTGTVAYSDVPGQGPHCNQNAGSFQVIVPPEYDSRSLGLFSDSEAWVRARTGRITVERSYVGMAAGDQGNGFYVTARAAAVGDRHEEAHIRNCRGHYNTHINPLLARVQNYIPRASGGGGMVITRFFQGAARMALEGIINWTSSIWDFQIASRADNGSGGVLDRQHRASANRLIDAGPGRVGGNAYQHRIHIFSEPAP